jgi:hypothetical protein
MGRFLLVWSCNLITAPPRLPRMLLEMLAKAVASEHGVNARPNPAYWPFAKVVVSLRLPPLVIVAVSVTPEVP